MKQTSTVRDLIALTKPSVTWLTIVMAAGGMWLAPGRADAALALWTLVGTALAVGSANALNMVLERDSDKLMHRTRRRPLPDGRMSAGVALAFGLAIGAAAMGILGALVNGVTALLGAFALLSYVLVYTPLKRRTPLALLIGAVPGAMPPLMGWTAVTGTVDVPGLVLFAILLVWQLPHFLAIALYNKPDYARAGIRVVPVVRGDRAAKLQALAYNTLLVPLSLMLVPLGVAGWIYGIAAIALGLWWLAVGIAGLRPEAGVQWARSFFRVSIIYLPALMVALSLDVVIR